MFSPQGIPIAETLRKEKTEGKMRIANPSSNIVHSVFLKTFAPNSFFFFSSLHSKHYSLSCSKTVKKKKGGSGEKNLGEGGDFEKEQIPQLELLVPLLMKRIGVHGNQWIEKTPLGLPPPPPKGPSTHGSTPTGNLLRSLETQLPPFPYPPKRKVILFSYGLFQGDLEARLT
ncbi:hypothetical protein CEXT_139251 [Caerostris extrusa]|uniref:Uncharacterized protein n=1 Tax=Caerostris extrusa TaxID=172846 RepID=A0AAV4XS81_CAEEX|nr:hypothetical protein CEXT_139251 [Caerostris extrusa]